MKEYFSKSKSVVYDKVVWIGVIKTMSSFYNTVLLTYVVLYLQNGYNLGWLHFLVITGLLEPYTLTASYLTVLSFTKWFVCRGK